MKNELLKYIFFKCQTNTQRNFYCLIFMSRIMRDFCFVIQHRNNLASSLHVGKTTTVYYYCVRTIKSELKDIIFYRPLSTSSQRLAQKMMIRIYCIVSHNFFQFKT